MRRQNTSRYTARRDTFARLLEERPRVTDVEAARVLGFNRNTIRKYRRDIAGLWRIEPQGSTLPTPQ